jgi:hypothetical protein
MRTAAKGWPPGPTGRMTATARATGGNGSRRTWTATAVAAVVATVAAATAAAAPSTVRTWRVVGARRGMRGRGSWTRGSGGRLRVPPLHVRAGHHAPVLRGREGGRPRPVLGARFEGGRGWNGVVGAAVGVVRHHVPLRSVRALPLPGPEVSAPTALTRC